MNEHRLERALRAGPPFATSYPAPNLRLDAKSGTGNWLRALALATVVVLLAGFLVAVLGLGSRRLLLVGLNCAEAGRATTVAASTWSAGGIGLALVDGAGAGMLGVSDDGSILLVDVATGATCATFRDPARGGDANVLSSAWSPDGGAFGFVLGSNSGEGAHDLFVLSRMGVARLAQSERPIGFRWSPDGRSLIVFTSFSRHAGTPVELLLVEADGAEPRELTLACDGCPEEPVGNIRNVAVSPDGRSLAVAFLPADEPGGSIDQGFGLWAGTLEDGRLERLPAPPLFLEGWLDAGTLLARDRSDPASWFAVPVAGGEPRPMAYAAPDFGDSPDGKHRLVVGANGGLSVLDLGSTGPAVVLEETFPIDGYAIWSPDSRSVAFGWPRAEAGNGGDIWVIGVDGGDRRRVSADGSVHYEGTRARGAWQPSWEVWNAN